MTAVGGNLPRYLQSPSQLPVDGQLVSNAGNNIAFFVSYDAEKRLLTYDGKLDVSKLEMTNLFVEEHERSIARLEGALVSLIEKTPKSS